MPAMVTTVRPPVAAIPADVSVERGVRGGSHHAVVLIADRAHDTGPGDGFPGPERRAVVVRSIS
jgi:hypothetical protein